jgi:hypothetical protein
VNKIRVSQDCYLKIDEDGGSILLIHAHSGERDVSITLDEQMVLQLMLVLAKALPEDIFPGFEETVPA